MEATWEDILTAYKIDSSNDIRILPKITESHVIEEKMKKMKVSHATQVFSYSMAGAITIMAQNNITDITGTYKMESKASRTAKILNFFDSLFDSLNGDSVKPPIGKSLRGTVSRNSPHLSFWKDCIRQLGNMSFRAANSQQRSVPSSLKNFIRTVEGFIDIRDILFSHSIDFFSPKSLNQDCLENFFGQIRQHGIRANNLNATQFEESYRSLLIQHISGSHSISANCEETFNNSLLQLQDLLKLGTPRPIQTFNLVENPDIHKEIFSFGNKIHKPISKVVNSVSRFILQKVVKKFNCPRCLTHIFKPTANTSSEGRIIFTKNFLKCIYNTILRN